MLSLLLAQDTTNYYYPSAADTAAATASATAAAGIGIGLLVFWIIFCGLGFILFLWALIDCIKRNFTNPNDKILWLVLIILIGWLGPILYLIIGRKKGSIAGAAPAK